MSWYYNTESGALTSAGAVQGFLQDLQAATGLAAGWHKLNIAATATEAQAAAEAAKEFPAGKAPTTSVAQQAKNATPIGNFADVGSALTAFYRKVTDGKMWRSLGWLLLGIALMFAGIAMIIGPSASRMSPLGAAKRALL